MALAGNDASSQLTSHDLEALADIQAELERIGSDMADDGGAADNYKLEQAIDVSLAEIETSTVVNTSSSTFNVVNSDDICPVLQDVVVESHSSPLPPESTPEPLIEEEVVEEEHGVMEEEHEVVVEGHELVEEEQIEEEMHETVVEEVHQEMVEEEQVVDDMTEVNAAIADFAEAAEVAVAPKEIAAPEAPKVLKPIYLIPNRAGGKTVTTVASGGGDNISRLIFTATNPISTAAGGGAAKPIITCTSKEAIDPKALAHAVMKSHVLQGVAGSGNTITKVIITSNPITGQSSTQTVSLAPGSPLAAAVASAAGPNAVITGMSQPLKIVATGTSQGGVGAAGGKTVTLAQTGLGSSGKQQIFTAMPGTPSKQQTIMVSKIALSPKTPTKIMIPVTVGKSPQKIAPAPLGTNAQFITKQGLLTALTGLSTTTMTTTAPKLGSIAVSPSKLIFKQGSPQTLSLKPGTLTSATSAGTLNSIGTNIKHIAVATSTGVQPIQVPGSKFSYIRLVSAPSSGTTTLGGKSQMLTAVARPIAPATQTSSVSSQVQVSTGSQLKIAVPIGSANSGQLIGQPMVASKHLTTGQRILIPASNVTNVSGFRPSSGNIAVPANALAQLPPGTTLFSPGGNLGNIVMLPAQYVAQFQAQATQAQTLSTSTASIAAATPISQASILPAKATTLHHGGPSTKATASSLPPPSLAHERMQSHVSSKLQINGRTTLEPEGVRPRKPCNCTKSQCLKLYCDCFANGEFCHNCNCNNCYNNLEHEEERQKAIKACLERNPHAFHPKIGKGNQGEIERRHNKGCNCKRSGCLKNYCECYEAKIMCSYMCKCIGCKNFADSAEKKTLMHLADAAEVRVQQQTAAKSKLSSQMHDVASKGPAGSATGERLPSSFITSEVVEATCQCLLAQAESGKEKNQPDDVVEKLVIEEFGRCLLQIIDYASKTKV